jgi:transmembrane sensor
MEETNSMYYTGLIAKYLKNEISEFEKNLLLEWVEEDSENKKLFLQISRTWALSSPGPENPTFDIGRAWNKVKHELHGISVRAEVEGATEAKVVPIHWGNTVMKYAASILLLLGVSFLIYTFFGRDQYIEVVSLAHEKKVIYLPDSSKIWLKENSTLSYAADFTKNRLVRLEGEAYFEVRKFERKPFTISGNRTITEVLGTSFDIRSYKSDSFDRIEVFSGKVSFESIAEGRISKVYLKPGMEAVSGRGRQIKVKQFETENALAWKEEKLIFDNTGMAEVAEALEGYFNIKIAFDRERLDTCRFTGTFDKPTLAEIQEVLSVSSNIALIKHNDIYRLSGQGCK